MESMPSSDDACTCVRRKEGGREGGEVRRERGEKETEVTTGRRERGEGGCRGDGGREQVVFREKKRRTRKRKGIQKGQSERGRKGDVSTCDMFNEVQY